LKNTIFVVLVLSGLSTTYGQSRFQYPQDGVYGGLEAGLALVVVDAHFPTTNDGIDYNEIFREGYTKSAISISLGYGTYFGENFVGIEGYYSLYTKKISGSFSDNIFDIDLSVSSKSELDLVIGKKIGVRSLLTLRGGLAFSDIKLSAVNTSGKISYTLDKNWIGYSVGMGYLYGISDKMSIKSKYQLSRIDNNRSSDARAKIVDNRVTLSLIYLIYE
jgi:opacity protein-like surface antigen